MYQSYIQKFIGSLKNGATEDPKKLYEIMANYDDLGEKITSINNSSLSDDDKKAQLKSLVSEYTKDNPEQSELITSLIDKDFSSALNVSKAVDILGNALNSLSNESKTKKMAFISGASKSDLAIAKDSTPDSYNFIKNDRKLSSLINKFDNDLNTLTSSEVKYNNKASRLKMKSEGIASMISKMTSVYNDLKLEEYVPDDEKIYEDEKNKQAFDIKEPLVSLEINKSESKINHSLNSESKSIENKHSIRKKLESKIIAESFVNKITDIIKQKEKSMSEKENLLFTEKLDANRRNSK